MAIPLIDFKFSCSNKKHKYFNDRFENDRTISFIPPDGEFELMSYRLNTHVSNQLKQIYLGLSEITYSYFMAARSKDHSIKI